VTSHNAKNFRESNRSCDHIFNREGDTTKPSVALPEEETVVRSDSDLAKKAGAIVQWHDERHTTLRSEGLPQPPAGC
jgi:hypothetical protein